MREGVAVREVRRELEQIAQRLLGHGIEAPGEAGGLVNIQVDRFKGEWIRWHTSMSDQDFLHRVIWWIDDPMINIYPGDWVQSLPTSYTERYADPLYIGKIGEFRRL